MDSSVEAYLNAIRQAPLALIEKYLTSVCTECGEHVVPSDLDGHVMVGSSVVIGCEGYWLIDPNVLGIPNPNWCDWTQPDEVESGPTTLYAQGEALVQCARGLGLVDSTFDPKVMGGMFYDEKLVGAAIAAMHAWLESKWGPVAVRAADREAMYFTEDESCIGQVPSFTYDGKRLSVGDTVTGTSRGPNGEERTFRGVLKEIEPTYWGAELCPTGLFVDGPDVPKDGSWDWASLRKVENPFIAVL